jgi:acyl-CoA hydrolase
MISDKVNYTTEGTMISKVKANLKNFIQITEEMTTAFYQRKDKQGYELYEKFLDALVDVVDELAYLNDNKMLQVDVSKINGMLAKALQALEINDTVTFADVIQFEILSDIKMYYNKL